MILIFLCCFVTLFNVIMFLCAALDLPVTIDGQHSIQFLSTDQ
jgi:hypothetical protein